MARKLKTYVTNLGFFELAVAAPSMKAALEAWGMSHNAFHQGFAMQTDDPRIVAAAMQKPGVVLKRAVGARGEFSENPELPQSLPAGARPVARRSAAKVTKPKRAEAKTGGKDKAAVISFEKEKAKRQRERAREEAADRARQERRERALTKARAELAEAASQHEEAMRGIEAEQKKLERRAQIENDRWDARRQRLEAAIARAGEA